MSAAAIIFLSALAVGAPDSGAEGPVKIKLWHSYNRAERDALNQTLDAFAATEPGFQVEASFVPFDALVDKLTNAIPRGHGPDVFIFPHDRIGGWAESSLLEPIELFVDEEMLDRHATACVFALAYGDSLYGLPLAHKALALFVRTDRVPKAPETFDELMAAAKLHTKKDQAKYGLVYPNADLFFHTPLLMSLGGRIFAAADPFHPNVVNEGVEKSLALANRLYAVEGLLPDDPTAAVMSSMFSEGRTPMVISGPWFRSEIDAGVPYTVAPLPAFPGGTPSSGFSTCEGVLMNRRSSNKKQSFELMRFLANDMRSAKIRMTVGAQTVTLDEAWKLVLPELGPGERAIFAAFQTAFQRSAPTPSHPSMNAVWTPMNAALYKAIHKNTPPAEAVKEAQERIEQGLGERN